MLVAASRPARRASAVALAVGVLFIAGVALCVGAAPVGPADLLRAVGAGLGWVELDPMVKAVLVDVRLPRVALGLGVGAALAVSGALMQAIFRNPLAEPALVGVSSGAALGAAAAIVFGAAVHLPEALQPVALPLLAATGGGITTLVVLRLSRRGGRTATATLLLAGLAITSLVNAVLGLALHWADDAELRNLTFWLLGSLGGARASHVTVALPFLVVPVILALRLAPPLDALLLGEEEARHLGIDVERLKRKAIALAAVAVGAAVALAGVIGFVGLLIPHLIRLGLGPGHGALLPRAALGGAGLIVLADIVARTAFPPTELPIGVLTALLGAPFFLWLLLRQEGRFAP